MPRKKHSFCKEVKNRGARPWTRDQLERAHYAILGWRARRRKHPRKGVVHPLKAKHEHDIEMEKLAHDSDIGAGEIGYEEIYQQGRG